MNFTPLDSPDRNDLDDRPARPAAAAPLRGHPALRRIDAGLADCARRLYGRASLPVSVGRERFSCCFEEAGTAQTVGLQLMLRCAGLEFELQVVEPQVLFGFGDALAAGVHAAAEVPAAIHRAAVLHALEPLRQAVERHLGQPIEVLEVRGVGAARPDRKALGLRIRRHDETGSCATAVLLHATSLAGWRALADAFATLSVRDAAPDIALTLSLRAAPVPLTFDELARIEAGDVLLLDATARRDALVAALFLNQGSKHQRLPGSAAELRGTRATITHAGSAPIHRAAARRPSHEAFAMSVPPTDRAQAPSAQGEAFDLDAVRVEVELELATLSLPLSALHALAVGQVFDTAQPIDGAGVVMWCGSQRLGVGQLVAIGDRLGVRVVALATNPPLPAFSASHLESTELAATAA